MAVLLKDQQDTAISPENMQMQGSDNKVKKIFNDLKRKGLFYYIITFSSVVVVIILILGAYLYQFYYRTIFDDYKNKNEIYLSVIRNQHENDLAFVDDIVGQLRLNSNETEFVLKAAPLKSKGLEEQIYRYKSVSRYFCQLFFFYHGDHYVYNHATSIDIQMFLNKGIILENTSKDELYNLLLSIEKGMKVLGEQPVDGYISKTFDDMAANVVVYFKPVEPKNTSTVMFIVGDYYYDSLLNSATEELRGNFIFYNDQVIASRSSLEIDGKGLVQKITDADNAQFKTVLDGRKYLVTVQAGESGLKYCTVQSMKIFQSKMVTGQWGILFIILICSIPASLLIAVLFRRLSRRIRTINVLLSDNKDDYYDLENIADGIRILVERNKRVDEESLSLRRTKFVNNFVRNDYVNRNTIIINAEKANMQINRNYFAVALMGDRGNSNENKAHKLMLSELEGQEYLDGYGIHLIIKNQSLFVVFGDNTTVLTELFEKFFVIGREFCEDFVMSTSEFHQNFTEASEAYLEADTAFDNRFLVDNSRIIHFSDIEKKEQIELLPDTYLYRLKNAIRSKDSLETDKVIQEIARHLQTSRQSLLTFRILCNDIIHMMIKEWYNKLSSFDNVYNVFSLSQCLTIQDFKDILWDVCSKLMDYNKSVVTTQSGFVAKAIDYMKSNYQNPDLNMSSLAEYLNISGVTLAVEFKNVMGISPSDYLAIVRVDNAKRLLKETGLLVKEVSVAVGYEDDIVFTRRFKKYVGKTPGQYRMEV